MSVNKESSPVVEELKSLEEDLKARRAVYSALSVVSDVAAKAAVDAATAANQPESTGGEELKRLRQVTGQTEK